MKGRNYLKNKLKKKHKQARNLVLFWGKAVYRLVGLKVTIQGVDRAAKKEDGDKSVIGVSRAKTNSFQEGELRNQIQPATSSHLRRLKPRLGEQSSAGKGKSWPQSRAKQRSERASGWVMPCENDNNIFLS